jgi:hypothetical protein
MKNFIFLFVLLSFVGSAAEAQQLVSPLRVTTCPEGEFISAINADKSVTCTVVPSAPTAGNPAAVAGPSAVNGSASTYMRSDAAPAVQLGTSGQPGLLQCDGATTTCSGGVITAVAGASPGTLSHDSTLAGTSFNGGSNVSDWGVNQSGTFNWTGAHTFGQVYGTAVTDAGTSRTLAATDCGKSIRFTSNSAITVTLSNDIAAGCHVALIQRGSGQITVTPAAGATMDNAHGYTKSFGQNAIIGVSTDSNAGGTSAAWLLTGDGA